MVQSSIEKANDGRLVLKVVVLDSYGRDEVINDLVCQDKVAMADEIIVEWSPPEIEPIDLSIYM